jgi:hypothetical protein
MKIPYSKIRQSIMLPDGDCVAVYEINSAIGTMERAELLRNVFRLKADGSPMWRIALYPAKEICAFLEVYLTKEGCLFAYNADSWEYEVGIETGDIKPHAFLK